MKYGIVPLECILLHLDLLFKFGLDLMRGLLETVGVGCGEGVEIGLDGGYGEEGGGL